MSSISLRCVTGPRPGRSQTGFSLIELLVVVAILAVLASFLAPTLSQARVRAQGIQCVSNGRQLMLGWLMYADDQDGLLCPNGSSPRQSWVSGLMNFEYNFTDNTNTAYLVDSQYARLSPYIRTPSLYRCPADRSMVRIDRKFMSRVRSIAMNAAVGSYAEGAPMSTSDGWRVYRKMNEVTAPPPAKLWVMMEQHPDSIDDARFTVDCQRRDRAAQLIEFPAGFHARSCNVSFADGHGEMHRWVNELTLQPLKYCGCLAHYAAEGHFMSCPNSVDVAWLQDRTSARRN